MAESSKTRKVVTRSPGRKVGIVNCRWFQDHPIEHESQLEKRFIQSAMQCQGVSEIRSQPFTIQLEWGKYTPDFLIVIGSQKIIIEIKPSSKVAQYLGVFDAATRMLHLKGLSFYVITQENIDWGYQAQVASEIYRHGKAEIAKETTDKVLQVLGQGEESRLEDLERKAQVRREVVLHMIARRWLRLHYEDCIEGQARISLAEYEPEKDLSSFEARYQVSPWVDGGAPRPVRAPRSTALKKRASVAVGPIVRDALHPSSQAEPDPMALVAGGFRYLPG